MDNGTDDMEIQCRMLQKILLPKQFIISFFLNLTNLISKIADKTRESCNYGILDNNKSILLLTC